MPTSHEDRRRIETIQRLAHILDSSVRIPGTRHTIGLDGILGLIPGVGDLITAAFSCYLVATAGKLGLPLGTRLRMIWNVLVDLAIGTIPLLGDLFDFVWKANRRNAALVVDGVRKAATRPPHPIGARKRNPEALLGPARNE